MAKATPALKFLLSMARAQAVMTRRFDSKLGGGIGFTDFLILYQLSLAEEGRMRRIDLAEKVGITASGITRLLPPMEKIGLVKREESKFDARVSIVALAPGGKRLLEERLEKAELLAEEALPGVKEAKLKELADICLQLGRLSV